MLHGHSIKSRNSELAFPSSAPPCLLNAFPSKKKKKKKEKERDHEFPAPTTNDSQRCPTANDDGIEGTVELLYETNRSRLCAKIRTEADLGCRSKKYASALADDLYFLMFVTRYAGAPLRRQLITQAIGITLTSHVRYNSLSIIHTQG